MLDFSLGPELEAAAPAEVRANGRDDVRLMVSHYMNDTIEHGTFRAIADYLHEGDALVINTSATLSAALNIRDDTGRDFVLHVSTQLAEGRWLVELRRPDENAGKPYFRARGGDVFHLPGGAVLRLAEAYSPLLAVLDTEGNVSAHTKHAKGGARLWQADVWGTGRIDEYLRRYGFPIRYSYVPQQWPAEFYQTVYATEYGSAEMPSAGRAFTAELITKLVAKGVRVVPVLLHTGVASLEAHEAPYAEYFRIRPAAAEILNSTKANGGRIVAVGTTSVRALESAVDERRRLQPAEGWTELVISPARGMRFVDALLTGLHEPQATHLAMLAALAGKQHIALCYDAALEQRYLWHEFGDVHLLLP